MIIKTEQQRLALVEHIQKLDLTKHAWLIEGEPYYPDKSDSQRALFHALARELAKKVGMTEGDVKALAKAKLLGTKPVQFRGLTIIVPDSPSSEKYSKQQYTDFIETLHWMASESGEVIGQGF